MNSSQKLKESQIPEKEKDKNKTQKSKEDAKEALKKIVEQARQAILENKLNATEEVHKAMIEYKEILGGENSVLLLPGLFIQAEAYIAEGKLKKAEEFLQAAYWNLYQYNKPKEKGSEDGNKMGQDISEKENAEYNGQLHKIFSKLYFAQKDYKKALAELTIGIYTDSCSSDPEHPQTSLNYYYMGQIFQQKKQTSEAEQFYAKTSQSENMMSDQDKKKLMDEFQKFDLNKDGQLTKDELLKVYSETLPPDRALKEVNTIFKRIDVNGSGKIDYQEFIIATIDQKKYFNREKLLMLFTQIDRDHSGELSRQEIKKLLRDIQIPINKYEQLVKQLDQDGDGAITQEEFLKMMLQI
ncbi:unnamed protein product [Paramecium primaurelia]|uniref:EF-hand domain-containing protein n=1 Tax=Paramecium primaurelia TaxID=5886 RepID=A0A8S1MKS4_PARPR|nr:unnamed protein product [Paramecium primaurelia]